MSDRTNIHNKSSMLADYRRVTTAEMTVKADTPRPGITRPVVPLVWLLELEASIALLVIPAGVLPSNNEKSKS